MVEQRPKRRVNNHSEDSDPIDWYMWRPCIGVEGVIRNLCEWKDLNDGTYSLADVERFNQIISSTINKRIAAMQNAP